VRHPAGFAYVGGTAGRGITYGRSVAPVQIYCDANFASCRDTRRSITGYAVGMYGGAVSWASKKQPTTAVSTMEAEYQACGAVARECLSLLKGLNKLACVCDDFPIDGPLIFCCDNQAALNLCKDRKDVTHHFARELIGLGTIQFVYIKSADNVGDCFTKALTRPVLERCLQGLGM
jgi:hypothetical protein